MTMTIRLIVNPERGTFRQNCNKMNQRYQHLVLQLPIALLIDVCCSSYTDTIVSNKYATTPDVFVDTSLKYYLIPSLRSMIQFDHAIYWSRIMNRSLKIWWWTLYVEIITINHSYITRPGSCISISWHEHCMLFARSCNYKHQFS